MIENGNPEELRARDLQQLAVRWVVDRHVSETWSDDDQDRLEIWLGESRANLLAYWCAEDNWNRTQLLGALRTIRPDPAREPARPPTHWARRASVAAVILAVGAVGVRYYEKPVQQQQRYATAVGGRETLALADGSQVELNTETVLHLGAAGGARTATLESGEAFFEIKHDAAHPFVLQVAGQRIVDLGTKFSVRTDGRRVEVALVEGLARIDSTNGKRSTLLKPGEVAVAIGGTVTVSTKSKSQLTNDLAWRSGVLVFDNTALSEVAVEFNRYNHKKIIVADGEVGRRRLMGSFEANDLEAVTNIAREVFKLHVDEKSDEILISR